MHIGTIWDIEQFWAFEKYANDNNWEFNTLSSLSGCIIFEFEEKKLHVFLLGLDCASSNKV